MGTALRIVCLRQCALWLGLLLLNSGCLLESHAFQTSQPMPSSPPAILPGQNKIEEGATSNTLSASPTFPLPMRASPRQASMSLWAVKLDNAEQEPEEQKGVPMKDKSEESFSRQRSETWSVSAINGSSNSAFDRKRNFEATRRKINNINKTWRGNKQHDKYNNASKHDKKVRNSEWYKQPGYQKKREFRRQWLEQATNTLLDTNPGTLIKGKWHELSSMLQAWSGFNKSDPAAPHMMERIIKRLQDERRAGNEEARMDIGMYNCLLDAWACAALFQTQDRPEIASQRAREILVVLQETYEADPSTQVMPTQESFNIVLHAVCRVEGPTVARRLLALMEYLHRVGKNPLAKPSKKDYRLVLTAYASGKPKEQRANTGPLAEGFLRHMILVGVTPDTFSYNIAIKAWTQARRGRESAEHADQILEEMVAPKDIITYSSVISAWAMSGMRAHAVARAEELLQEIEQDPKLEPNTVVLNTVMSAWVKSRSPGAVKRTAELLQQMEESDADHTRPDLISYNTHLHAVSLQSKKPGMAQAADALLQRMEELYATGKVDFAPNLFTYNLVIEAWSNSPDPNAAMRAAQVLRKLTKVQHSALLPSGVSPPSKSSVEPDTFSFNQVLAALAKEGKAQNAEELLVYMDEAYGLGVHPRARPDSISYSSVIQAHARSGLPGAAQKAEKLLQHLKSRYYIHGEEHLKPTRKVYNSVIHCWARSREGTLGARRAEALLQEMQLLHKQYNDSSIAPNLVTFNSLLNAWALSGTRCCGVKAERYLDQMWKMYNEGDNNLVKPNDMSYNTVINAISKSQNEAKAQRALRILRRMDKLYQAGVNKEARPNEVTYTAVLNSCAFPAKLDERTRRKALDTAIFTLEELKRSRYGQPNQVTYGTFLKACANLLPEDDELRRAVIRTAFEACCKDGQVGEMVLMHLKTAAPADLYRELVVDAVLSTRQDSEAESTSSHLVVSVEDLPPEWRAKVRGGRPLRSKSRTVLPRRSPQSQGQQPSGLRP